MVKEYTPSVSVSVTEIAVSPAITVMLVSSHPVSGVTIKSTACPKTATFVCMFKSTDPFTMDSSTFTPKYTLLNPTLEAISFPLEDAVFPDIVPSTNVQTLETLMYTPPPWDPAEFAVMLPFSIIRELPPNQIPPPFFPAVFPEISPSYTRKQPLSAIFMPPPFTVAELLEIVPPLRMRVLLFPATYTPPPFLAVLPQIVTSFMVTVPPDFTQIPPPVDLVFPPVICPSPLSSNEPSTTKTPPFSFASVRFLLMVCPFKLIERSFEEGIFSGTSFSPATTSEDRVITA